jgi:nitroreductase
VTAPPQIALLFFVQRVEGILPGIYLLPRARDHERKLRALLPNNYALTPQADMPELLQLTASAPDPQTFRRVLRSLHCHQDIAATANVAVAMLAPVHAAVMRDPADYRHVLREAGMIGQALYLHAEAAGLRGTGIGCYFDDPLHDFVGLSGGDYQSVYHFTLGLPIVDTRVEMGPAYPRRDGPRTA